MSHSISSETSSRPSRAAIVEKSTRWTRWLINVVLSIVLFVVAINVLFPPLCSPEGFRRSGCQNNLKHIGLALHNYHDAYACFPPAFIADETGRPMHSWRVLLLPYLDRFDLYKQYRFDEPWDGPNNQKLAGKIGDIFRCPTEKASAAASSATSTNYVAVVGPQTAWPGWKSTKIQDFADGMSNSIFIVEVADSGVHWMEPRDLHVLQMSPTINGKSGQGPSSRHHAGAYHLLADGAVRFATEDLPAQTIQTLLTIKGGEPAPDF